MFTPAAGGKAEQINDSPVIAERLLDAIGAAKLAPVNTKPNADFRSGRAMEWATWSDSRLAVLLFPNITRSFGEAYEAFGYVQAVPHFSTVDKISNQLVGSFAMWMVRAPLLRPGDAPVGRSNDAEARHEARARWRTRPRSSPRPAGAGEDQEKVWDRR